MILTPYKKTHLLMTAILLVATHSFATEIYEDSFYLKDYFVDKRELFNNDMTQKKEIDDKAYQHFEFKKTNKLNLIFDKGAYGGSYVPDNSGDAPVKELFLPNTIYSIRVTIQIGLEHLEVLELMDLQAFSGCIDQKKHPVNMAVLQFDPQKSVKEVKLNIVMPCLRYYSLPQPPFESVLLLKAKTTDGYYYAVQKIYSTTQQLCYSLMCRIGNPNE